MLSSFLQILILLIYPLMGLVIGFVILSFYWEKIFNAFNLKAYKNVQKVHKNEVSRLGGLLVYLFLLSLVFLKFIDQKFIFNIIISSIPFIFVSIKEDLFHNSGPNLRLASMIVSCFIFLYLNPMRYPVIDIPYIGDLLSHYPLNFIFFTFSVLVVMNGMNLIDGMNGLFGLTALFQLFSIALISILLGDYEIIILSFIFIAPLIMFLCFNFPFGKVFAGDTGAYFYGFINGLLSIYLFGKHDEILSWMAVLIFFYPCIELLFSFIRKISSGISPLTPDNKHLHTLIFNKLLSKYNKTNLSNFMTTFILSPMYIIPTVYIFFCYSNVNLYSIFLVLSVFLVSYIFLYKKIK
jgi:UDP-GlcNAc:undecaprenyl-phosphate/decaprenyl-phosphate GlcNAc-1-phosphate transferase